MARMVAVTTELMHQAGHPGQRPQIGDMPGGQRPRFERGDQFQGLRGTQTRLAPRPALALEGGLAAGFPSRAPAPNRLPAGLEAARHFRIGESLVEAFRRPMAALFQFFMIACFCHPRILPDDFLIVTLLYEYQ